MPLLNFLVFCTLRSGFFCMKLGDYKGFKGDLGGFFFSGKCFFGPKSGQGSPNLSQNQHFQLLDLLLAEKAALNGGIRNSSLADLGPANLGPAVNLGRRIKGQ